MKTPWKTLIALGVALPMVAYVVGALVAVEAAPSSHETLVLTPDSASPSDGPSSTPDPSPSSDDVDPVQEVTPTPDDLDDDTDNSGRDDDSGHHQNGDDDSDDADDADDDGGHHQRGKDADDNDNSGPGNATMMTTRPTPRLRFWRRHTGTTTTRATTTAVAVAVTAAADQTIQARSAAVRTTSSDNDAPEANADNPRRSDRPGLSVRTRIIVALAVLVTIALTSAGLIIYALESARLKAAAVSQADQELAEFAELQRSENFTDIDPLLNTFLTRNVPNDYEMLVGWIDGSPRYRSGQHHPTLTDDPQFRADVTAAMSGTNESHIVDSPYGDLLLTVQPVATTATPAPRRSGRARCRDLPRRHAR